MEENTVFWDKNINKAEFKKILKHDTNERFVEFASLFLSRTNDPKEVFSQYLNKSIFCKNWHKIKKQMRKNRWNDDRIIFWDEIYRIVKQDMVKDESDITKEKKRNIKPEIKKIGDKIRTFRKQKGWTQKVLAAKTNLSQQTISFVESGYINISFLTLKKITDILNLEIDIRDRTKKESTINDSTGTVTSSYPQ